MLAKEQEVSYKISLNKFLWWDQETFLQEEIETMMGF